MLRRGGPLSVSWVILCTGYPPEHVGLVCRMAVGGVDKLWSDGTYVCRMRLEVFELSGPLCPLRSACVDF